MSQVKKPPAIPVANEGVVGCSRELDVSDDRDGLLLQGILMLGQRLTALEQTIADMHSIIQDQRVEKEWYTTSELAEAMSVSQYTVQERWCNQARVEAQKDPDTGKWRIPGHEFRRLTNGGGLLPRPRPST